MQFTGEQLDQTASTTCGLGSTTQRLADSLQLIFFARH